MMARKSMQKRILDTQTTIELYKKAGIDRGKPYDFMVQMFCMMNRGKYPTKGQRNWLDKLCEEGIPRSKAKGTDSEFLELLQKNIGKEGLSEFEQKIVKDFSGLLFKGIKLSEKQLLLVNKIVAKIKDIDENGYWRPSDQQIKDLEACCSLASFSSDYSWQYRWNLRQNINKARNWHRSYTIYLRSNKEGSFPFIEKDIIEHILKSYKNKLKCINNPKFNDGDMCYYNNGIALVISVPKVSTKLKCIAQEILVGGKDIEVPVESLKKRRSRK